jgi:ankyrin repeat protein/WD40 repeat protein
MFGKRIVELWQVREGTLRDTLQPSGEVHSVTFSPDGKALAVGSGDWLGRPKPVIEIWDLDKKAVVKTLAGHAFDIISLAFSKDGNTLSSADAQGILKLWDLTSGKMLHSMGEEDFHIKMAVSPDGRLGAEPDQDGTIRVYDLTTEKIVATLPGNPRVLSEMTVSPDGTTVVTAGTIEYPRREGRDRQQELNLWNTGTGNLIGFPTTDDDLVSGSIAVTNTFAVTVGREYVRDGGEKRTFTVWERSNPQVRHVLSDPTCDVFAVAVAPDGQSIAVAGAKAIPLREGIHSGPYPPRIPRLDLLDIHTGHRLQTFIGHTDTVTAVAFLNQGHVLMSVSADSTVRYWDVKTGRAIRRVSLQRKNLPNPEWGAGTLLSRDGRFVGSVQPFGPCSLSLFDTGSGRLIHSFAVPETENSRFALSSDGMRVAVGSNGILRLWDRHTGKSLTREIGTGAIQALEFAPDGQVLSSLDFDGSLRYWRTRDGKLLATSVLLGERDWITFTPDGDYEGSDGVDTWIRWRVGGKLSPASRFHTLFYRPEKVQIALSGHPQMALYASLRQQERTLRAAASRELLMIAAKKNSPLTKTSTPSEALKDALTTMNMLGGGALEEQVAGKVKTLLAAGADINTQGGWGTTPLMFLASHGDAEGVRSLIQQKAKLDLVDTYGDTALTQAARDGHREIFQMLLEAGADLKDKTGKSLLPLRGNPTALGKSLLAILVPDPRAPKTHSFQFPPVGLCMALLYLGADPNVRDAEGNAALLTTGAKDLSLLRLLLEKGANANVQDKEGETALIEESGQLEPEAVRLLLEHGADVNLRDKSGWNALLMAASRGNTEIVKLLLEHQADPNASVPGDQDGRTPLILASSEGYIEIVRLLLDHGANVNTVNLYDHESALTCAVYHQDKTTVKLLLDHGADATVRTREGKSLLSLLKMNDPKDKFGIAPLLKQAGAKE